MDDVAAVKCCKCRGEGMKQWSRFVDVHGASSSHASAEGLAFDVLMSDCDAIVDVASFDQLGKAGRVKFAGETSCNEVALKATAVAGRFRMKHLESHITVFTLGEVGGG